VVIFAAAVRFSSLNQSPKRDLPDGFYAFPNGDGLFWQF